MRILDSGFVAAWRDRLVNIHPSLLPAFPGLHPQRQALEAKGCAKFSRLHRRISSATRSIPGRSSRRAVVPVLADDDEDRLAGRASSPRSTGSIRSLCGSSPRGGCAIAHGNRVTVAEAREPEGPLINLPDDAAVAAPLPRPAVRLYLAQELYLDARRGRRWRLLDPDYRTALPVLDRLHQVDEVRDHVCRDPLGPARVFPGLAV